MTILATDDTLKGIIDHTGALRCASCTHRVATAGHENGEVVIMCSACHRLNAFAFPTALLLTPEMLAYLTLAERTDALIIQVLQDFIAQRRSRRA